MQNPQHTSIEQQIHLWVNLYGDDLYRWAFSKTNHKEVAEDLVQETFLAAFKAIEGFQEKSQPKTWLFSIMKNKVMDYHRRKFRDLTVNTSQANITEEGLAFDEEGRWVKGLNPTLWSDLEGHLLDDAEFNKVFKSCMEELPEYWFHAIQLKYIGGKDGKEICQELGVSPSNFWQIIHRAKIALKSCLEKLWF